MRFEFIQKFLHKNNKGQTLIEAVVTIGVALVIITSVVALVNASNRRATYARQATQASKLAQEGMEIVRHIRDVDGDGLVRVGTSDTNPICPVNPFCAWSDLYTEAQETLPSHLEFDCDDGGPEDDQWCLIDGAPAVGTTEATLLDIFIRTVEISDDPITPLGPICATSSGGPDLTLNDIKRIRIHSRMEWS